MDGKTEHHEQRGNRGGPTHSSSTCFMRTDTLQASLVTSLIGRKSGQERSKTASGPAWGKGGEVEDHNPRAAYWFSIWSWRRAMLPCSSSRFSLEDDWLGSSFFT